MFLILLSGCKTTTTKQPVKAMDIILPAYNAEALTPVSEDIQQGKSLVEEPVEPSVPPKTVFNLWFEFNNEYILWNDPKNFTFKVYKSNSLTGPRQLIYQGTNNIYTETNYNPICFYFGVASNNILHTVYQ